MLHLDRARRAQPQQGKFCVWFDILQLAGIFATLEPGEGTIRKATGLQSMPMQPRTHVDIYLFDDHETCPALRDQPDQNVVDVLMPALIGE